MCDIAPWFVRACTFRRALGHLPWKRGATGDMAAAGRAADRGGARGPRAALRRRLRSPHRGRAQRQGHAYLTVLGPLVAVLIAAAIANVVLALARGTLSGRPAP